MDHVPPARQHDAVRAGADVPARPAAPGRTLKRGLFLALCLVLAAAFAALGAWQVERLGWKQALVRTVEARLDAPPGPPPAFADWAPSQAYTRVALTGVFLHDHETLVQAVTDLGPGWWVVTPLRTEQGVVLVNRGFVPAERRDVSTRPAGQVDGPVRVAGLLRASEPGGAFLRANAPADGRWYSRDVPAIARAKGLAQPVAPFFVDADATPNPGGYPAGGLTVVQFRNSHLTYALTWFGLALLALAGAGLVWRHGRR